MRGRNLLFIFDQSTTSKLERIYQKDHTYKGYQISVMEWLDSLIYTPKYTNQNLKQQEAQVYSPQNKLCNQRHKVKSKKQLTNEQEIIVAVGTNDNEDNDQSEHTIKPKYFTNGNDGLRMNDSGTQLQATINGEANPKISIKQISTNNPPHNVNGSDGLGGNN
ncbi:MAG: hypothetical protein EZS28_021943 [Streblomastix strix]|uniref:Uncharacterized protein n=1 Tax=Streblomastix strix TaxID=222440 RepID=A0A5J4VJX9_9EUKA|nr:MAG: hypothetical protein EZS28_021943 [Streblomastix strix]